VSGGRVSGRLRRFQNGQRVIVFVAECAPILAKAGCVVRLRRADNGAWVRLDTRVQPEVHPFPPDDPRGNDVLAYPEDCCAE
jgi:hypothetical protein